MIKKAALLCVTMLCIIVLVTGCVSSRPYTVLKPMNDPNLKSRHGVDLSVLNFTSTLKNSSGPGNITFELMITNIDLNDYTIKADCIELKTLSNMILQPTSTEDNNNVFLTLNHTNPNERVMVNVTFKVPENEYPSVLRYVDRDFSIEVFLMLKNPTFVVTRLHGPTDTVKVLLADMGDATSIENAKWTSGVNSSQTMDAPPTHVDKVSQVVPTGRPAHLVATADVEFSGYRNLSMVIIDTWIY